MLNIGDAVLTFLGDTSQLDQVFARLPAQTEAAMGAATASVGRLGDAVGGVNFELDATAQNVPYCGEIIKESMAVGEKATHEARGEAALLGEAFGVHLPRHVRSFIAEIPGVSTALSAAFSATAIFFLIEALAQVIEKIQAFREHAHEVELAWDGFNTAILSSFGSLDDKVLESGIAVDKLRGDHLSALRKELELIDHASMRDLMSEFDLLAKASDAMFAQLKRSWLEFDAGSTGAKSALTDFKAQYDLLLAEGKGKEASDLLAGTLKSARDTLTAMEKQNDEADKQAKAMRESNAQAGAAAAFYQLIQTHKEGELKAQETIIRALQAQVDAEKKISEYTNDRKGVKEVQEDNREITEKERVLKAEAQAEQKALTEEDQLRTEARNRAIAGLQQEEKEKIAATAKGSQAQLSAIDAAIKEEQTKGLQDTAFYRSLQEQKVRFLQAALDLEKKVADQAAASLLVKAENDAKVETAVISQQSSEQEKAVERLAGFKLLSATQTSRQLEILYAAENKKLLGILNDLLKKEQDAIKAAQAKLSAAQANPFISPEEIADLKRLLQQAEKAEADTQVKISNTTKQFQDKQLSLDKGHYGQALAIATAFGNAILAEKLKENHAALLVAQAQLAEAKARGANTDAINKQVKALQHVENELNKEARGLKTTSGAVDKFKEDLKAAAQEEVATFSSATEAMITGQASFGKAMESGTLKVIGGLAQKWGDYYAALAIADLLTPGAQAKGAAELAASVALFTLAGAASGFASNLSSGGNAAGAKPGNAITPDSSTQAGKQPVATANVPHLASGAIVTKPTQVVVGDKQGGGSGVEGVFPLDDRRAAQAINRLFGGEGTGGGIHNHFYVRGMLSTQDLAKTARIITRGAQTGRLNVSVRNSSRVTRRS